MFYQVAHKGGESEINHIERFHNSKAFEISVGSSYTEDKLMHTFLIFFQKGGKFSTQIASNQTESRREGKIIDKNNYLYLTYKLIIRVFQCSKK